MSTYTDLKRELGEGVHGLPVWIVDPARAVQIAPTLVALVAEGWEVKLRPWNTEAPDNGQVRIALDKTA